MNDVEDNYILDVVKRLRDKKSTGSFKVYLKFGEIVNVVEEVSTLKKDFTK